MSDLLTNIIAMPAEGKLLWLGIIVFYWWLVRLVVSSYRDVSGSGSGRY